MTTEATLHPSAVARGGRLLVLSRTLASALALFLLGCQGEKKKTTPPEPAPIEEPGEEEEPGGEDPKEPPEEEDPGEEDPEDPSPSGPSWAAFRLRQKLRVPQFGAVGPVHAGPLGREGLPGLVTGGRRLAALPGDGASPLWTRDIPGMAIDEVATQVLALPGAEGVDDFLVTTSHHRALRFAGADGALVWEKALDPELPHLLFPRLTIFGDEDDPLFATPLGKEVRSWEDGEARWRFELPFPPLHQSALRASGGERRVLAIAPPPVENEAASDLLLLDVDGSPLLKLALEKEVTGLATLEGAHEGEDVLLVGTIGGWVHAYTAAGDRLWSHQTGLPDMQEWETLAVPVQAPSGLGARAQAVVLIAPTRGSDAKFISLSAEGAPQWEHAVSGLVVDTAFLPGESDGGFAFTLREESGWTGSLSVLETGDLLPPRERLRWSHSGLPFLANGPHSLAADEAGRLWVSAGDSKILGFDGADGTLLEERYLGQSAMAFPVDDGVVTLDGYGNLSRLDTTGRRLWHRRLEDEATPAPRYAFAFRGPKGPEYVFISGRVDASGSPIHVYRPADDGMERGSLPALPHAAILADLDGSGRPELVVADLGFDCSVSARDLPGTRIRWQAKLQVCTYALGGVLAAGRVAGDSYVALGISSYQSYPVVTLLGPDGTMRWSRQVEAMPDWLQIGEEGVYVGGFGAEGEIVSLLELRNGTPRWTRSLPGKEQAGSILSSADGVVVPPLGAEGEEGIVVTTLGNEVYFLDGKTGAPRWSHRIESTAVPIAPEHSGGPVAFLPGSDRSPPLLLVAQHGDPFQPSNLLALSVEGELLGSYEIPGGDAMIGADKRASGETMAVITAEEGLFILEVEAIR